MSNENQNLPEGAETDLPDEPAPPVVKKKGALRSMLSKRSTKIALGVIVAFGIILSTSGNKDDEKQSNLGVKPPDRPQTDPNMVDPRIAGVLKERDAKNAKALENNPDALRAGASYLPRVTNEIEDPLGAYAKASTGQGAPVSIPVPPPLPPPVAPPPTATNATPLPSGSQGPKGDVRYVVLAKAMKKALSRERLAIDPELTTVEAKDTNKLSSTSDAGAGQVPEATPASSKPPPKIVAHLGELFYGTMDLEANSDYSTFVQATVIGGPMNGAKLQGAFKRTTDRLEIIFSKASLDGKTLAVSAIATHPENKEIGLATDVNHHYLTRFGGLFTAAFIRGYGENLEREGTEVTVNADTGTVVESTPNRSNKDLALLGGAEVADEASQYLRGAVNRPPTVVVAANTPIGILLRGDVIDVTAPVDPQKAPDQLPSQITPQPLPAPAEGQTTAFVDSVPVPRPVSTAPSQFDSQTMRLQDYAQSVTENNRKRERKTTTPMLSASPPRPEPQDLP